MRKFKQKGISPVIGVILLVAVTVALVALVTVIVFDIGSDVNETSSSAVQTSTGSNGVQVQVLRNDNVEQFEVVGPDGKTDNISGDVGDSLNIGDGAGQYLVKAILDDGSEEVIDTINVEEGSSASEVRTGTDESTGTVSVNPDIEGAIVQSIEDGIIVDETTTDENGEYTIEYSEDSEILVMVDGFEHEELKHTLYASAERSDYTDNIDYTFEDSVATVDDENVLIANTVTEEDTNTKTISTLQELQAVNEGLSGDYKLVRDIDAIETADWNEIDSITEEKGSFSGDDAGTRFTLSYSIGNVNSVIDTDDDTSVDYTVIDNDEGIIEINEDTGSEIKIDYNLKNTAYQGFKPIGDAGWGERVEDEFNGSLDGQGYEMEGLTIDRPEDNVGLIGFSDGTIENVGIVDNYITGNSDVGGLVGRNNDGNISKSYATGTATGVERIGGLVGLNSGGEISKSYATGTATGVERIGGLVGWNSGSGEISKSYSAGDVEGTEERSGGLVGDNSGTSDISNSNSTADVIGDYLVGGLIGINFGETSESYAEGNVEGTDDRVGGLTGNNQGTVSDSYATGDVTGDKDRVGGLAGMNWEGTVSDSYATGDVDGSLDRIGGLIGQTTRSDVSNSNATGNVTGVDEVGGLVGYDFDGTEVSDSYATGDVEGTGKRVGGLMGHNHGGGFENFDVNDIVNSHAKGDVRGENSVGGLIGLNTDDAGVLNTYANGNVTGDGRNIGGLIGQNTYDSQLSESYATGSVNGTSLVGGLVGYNVQRADVSESYATGSVTGQRSTGGLVGSNLAVVSESYATGNVTGMGGDYIGGFVGTNSANAILSESYAKGNVTGGGGEKIGGFAGSSTAELSESYATGSVKSEGGDDIGGFVGHTGINEEIIDAYWDTESSEKSTSDMGWGRTTSQMTGSNAENNMSGFDFTNTWTIVEDPDDYPELQWQEE